MEFANETNLYIGSNTNNTDESCNFINTNVSHKLIDLDPDTKTQLTLKHIRSNIKSDWTDVNAQIESAYNSGNIWLIEELITRYTIQLLLDDHAFVEGKTVSECALFAPRAHSTYNRDERQIRFVNRIAESMFLSGQKPRAVSMVHAITIYSQVISRLTTKYIKQYTEIFILNNKFKLGRILEHNRGNFCLLKNKPLNSTVLEPTAMPVKISEYEELEEFFKFLDSNGEVIVNEYGSDPCMKFNRGAIYQDKRMDLCKQVVGPTWIGQLMKSLKYNDKVEHFLLGNNIIGEAGGRAIREFLLTPHIPKIKTWYIAGNDINAQAIGDIVDGLSSDPDMVSLWLKRNPLKPEGIQHIARLLVSNQNIKVLDLHNTAVLDEGIGYLVSGLKANRSLKHLYLDANGLTEACVDDLIGYFEYLIEHDIKGVTSLWIDMNKLFDSGVSKLVKTLSKYRFLKRLILGSNGLTDACVDDIVDAFISHPTLKVLDLGMYKSTSDMGMITNNIGDSGASKLCRLIESNNTIQYLSVMMNGITISGLELLANSIQSNNSIKFFDYKQYGIQSYQQVSSIITSKLKSNRGDSKIELRNIKHGNKIRFIDSIYRNSMK
jgi:Ran GTPase-activating protein (RanGAP) involved in mRNA processing and transport